MRAGRQPVETALGRSWEATIKAPATTRNSDQGRREKRMKRYHIIKDGQIVAAMPTKEEALDYIHRHQERETHYIRSEYGYIYGEEIYIKYKPA